MLELRPCFTFVAFIASVAFATFIAFALIIANIATFKTSFMDLPSSVPFEPSIMDSVHPFMG